MSDHRDSTTAPKSIGELTENIISNLRDGKPWNVIIDVNRHNLERLSMRELSVVMDATLAARDAVTGVFNQPRCHGKAGEEVEAILDSLNDCLDLIIDVANDAKPTSADDAEERAFLIVRNDAAIKDDAKLLLETAMRVCGDAIALRSVEEML